MPATRTRRPLLAGVAAFALLHGGSAMALPVLGAAPPQVSAGGGQPVIATGAGAVRVDLNAPRTIIDWASFNLTAAERADFVFDQRSWIVVNRVTGSAINIDGRVFAGQAANLNAALPATPGGNVWFYSPQGVIFGANARVDVGGLMATSAAPNTAQFLTPGNNNITFTGTGAGGSVTVAGGAQFNATAHIAFAAPRVATSAGSAVTVSDYGSALYLGADTFELQFFPTFNDDLSLFTFIVPNRGAGTANPQALSIAGQTTSGTIYLAAYSRGAVASELINAPGLLTARSSFAEYGQVTITTGRNVILGQPGPGDNPPVANQVTGLTVGHARIGEVNADGNVNIILTGVSYDAGPQGDLTATRVRAGQGLVIGGSTVNIPGGVSSGDAGVNARSAHIVAGRELTIPTITAAGDLFFGSRFNSSTFDRATSGGNLTIRNAQTVSGNLLSSVGSLTINSGGAVNVANLSGGAVNISIGGAVNVTNLTGSTSLTVGSTGAQTYGSVTGGTVSLSTAGAINATTLTGSTVSAASVGALRVVSASATTSFAAGSNTSVDLGSVTAPSFAATSLVVRLGAVDVSGNALVRTPQMDLAASFTAANLSIEGSGGVFRLGGDGPLGLTNAELQRIRVTGALNLYAGQTVATAGNPNPLYADFEVLDVTVDTTRIPRLNLFAHGGRQVSVTGLVDVIGEGGVLQIGDPGNDAWRPDRIVITGALGRASGDPLAGYTDVHGFRSVALHAADDILIGSSRFIDLVRDAPPESIDLARGLPLGVAAQGDEQGRLFLVAGRATLAAGDRILQQNTGVLGQEAGVYLSGAGVDEGDPLLTLGGGASADLFGALGGETGVVSGRMASFSQRITVDTDGAPRSGVLRLNGCPLGVGCAVSTPADHFRLDRFRPAAPAAAIDPPVLVPVLPGVDDDERETDPVITGAGNEEIWRKPQ